MAHSQEKTYRDDGKKAAHPSLRAFILIKPALLISRALGGEANHAFLRTALQINFLITVSQPDQQSCLKSDILSDSCELCSTVSTETWIAQEELRLILLKLSDVS
jgi:hypothetical protein